MTVPVETSAVEYAGNDSATDFSVPFAFLENGDLLVTLTTDGVPAVQALVTHYTVAGAGETSGTVTMLAAPATGTTLRIERVVDLTQPINFRTYGPFSPATHEAALDRLTMAVQQVKRDADDALEEMSDALATMEADVATTTTSVATLMDNLADADGDIDAVAFLTQPHTWTGENSFEESLLVGGLNVWAILNGLAEPLVLVGGSLVGMSGDPVAVKKGNLTVLHGTLLNDTGSSVSADTDLAQVPLELRPVSPGVYFPAVIVNLAGAATATSVLVDSLGYIQCKAAIPDDSSLHLEGLQWWNEEPT